MPHDSKVFTLMIWQERICRSAEQSTILTHCDVHIMREDSLDGEKVFSEQFHSAT